MMQNSNSSVVSYFILGAYLDIGKIRYLYFLIVILLYMVILLVNTSLIILISMNRSLHEPMYILLCSLFVNELYGSTALFPFLLAQILSDVHTISVSFCFLQIFMVYSYANIEFCTLAIMSYDRYLAICCPLQYNTRMTLNKVLMHIVAAWLYSFMNILVLLSLNIPLTLCENVLNNLYCHNYLVVKMACSGIEVSTIYGLFMMVHTVLVPLILIIFSYIEILQVCFSGSNQTRQKAVSTCTPHLVSLINFTFGCCFEILQSRFDMTHVPAVLRIILSLYFLIIQPLMNPVMYGLHMSKIRKIFLLFYKMTNRDEV